MNRLNHFLAPFAVLLLLFGSSVSVTELAAFSFVFGVLIDEDVRLGRRLGKPLHHRRTWLQEPLGAVIIGLPVGIVLSAIRQEYFLMTLVPYALHIVQDYLTIHEVSPLAPFSGRNMRTGFFMAEPPEKWYTGKEHGVSENYFLLLIAAVLVVAFSRFLIP